MQFKFKSNKPWNTETPRLATSWPLGERSEPFLAAKRPNASDEGLFWKSKKHRHKTDRNPPITNQKPWSIDWPLENTYSSFLRGQLRCKGQFRFWLTSQKIPNFFFLCRSKKHRHKTDRNPPITNQKPWSIDWPLENTYSSFLRGQLRCKGQFRFWLTSQKIPNSEHVFDITGRVLSETTSRFSVKAKETRMKRVFHEPHFRT